MWATLTSIQIFESINTLSITKFIFNHFTLIERKITSLLFFHIRFISTITIQHLYINSDYGDNTTIKQHRLSPLLDVINFNYITSLIFVDVHCASNYDIKF